MPGERVDVRLRTWTMVLPCRTAVARAHQPSELDADQQQIGFVRARRNPPHMRRPRSRREAPRRPRRQLQERFELLPAVAAVVAAKQAARFGPGIDSTVGSADGEREDAPLGQRAVEPAASSVARPPDTTLAQTRVHGVRIVWIDGQALGAASVEEELRGPR